MDAYEYKDDPVRRFGIYVPWNISPAEVLRTVATYLDEQEVEGHIDSIIQRPSGCIRRSCFEYGDKELVEVTVAP